ncbi:MAG: DUF4038 domain-containing protein [Kiritimatiellae bacterium]|nr:DUF4038 domain-containing protein [Kiritimatiellia bacterium]
MSNQENRIPLYGLFEIRLEAGQHYDNPFTDVRVETEVTAPSGATRLCRAFHDGDGIWHVRFAPEETGRWRYATRCSEPADTGLHAQRGEFECAPSESHGFIRPAASDPYWFAFSDGAPFFGMGDTCYGLASGITAEQRREYLDARAKQRFNFIRFFAVGYPLGAEAGTPQDKAVTAGPWPWGGTRAEPDYDRLNPAFFRHLEAVLGELRARNLYAELLVCNYYTAPFRNPAVWTEARESLWTQYLVARFAAEPAVFMWTVTNEYLCYPDGRYRYEAADDDWVRRMARLIHEADPHRHPVSAHPEPQQLPQGPKFGRDADIDVLHQQYNTYENAVWTGKCWEGAAAGLDCMLRRDRRYGKPVINTESGYEWLEGYPANFARQVSSTDKCRHSLWRIFTAGGAACAAGFAGTWHGRDGHWRDEEAPFVVADQGLGEQAKRFYEFVTGRTGFTRMTSAQDIVHPPHLCLANPGQEYIVYTPARESPPMLVLDLRGDTARYRARFFNPRNGEEAEEMQIDGGDLRRFELPDNNDWVLHLRVRQ